MNFDELIDSQTAAFQREFQRYLEKFKEKATFDIIREYLEIGRDDLALEWIEKQLDQFNPLFLLIFMQAAAFEVAQLKQKITVNPTNFYVNRRIQQLQQTFIQQMVASARSLISKIIIEGKLSRKSIRQITRDVLDNLGLNDQQYEAVKNYRRLLEENSRQALDRELRDKRFDRTVDRAIREGKPLTPEQIDRMVLAYKRKFEKSRAEFIARTEAKRIVEESRDEAANQVLNELGLQPGDMVKEWRSMRDERVRRTHQHGSLDGQKVRQDQPFISISGARLMYPGDLNAPISETANCRCHVIRYIQPIGD